MTLANVRVYRVTKRQKENIQKEEDIELYSIIIVMKYFPHLATLYHYCRYTVIKLE